jgi:hypothetical protein
MRTRLAAALGTAAAVAAAVATAAPAYAAPTGDTTVTFTIDSGTLDITVPVSSDLGTGDPGTTISGQLGPVTVVDSRALLTAAWAATVSSTDFTTGGATPGETVAVGDVDYWSGPFTATVGTGTFNPGQPTNSTAFPLTGAPQPVASLSEGSGNNSATWNPTLDVAVPAGAVGGTYTGTVTHSVA